MSETVKAARDKVDAELRAAILPRLRDAEVEALFRDLREPTKFHFRCPKAWINGPDELEAAGYRYDREAGMWCRRKINRWLWACASYRIGDTQWTASIHVGGKCDSPAI